MSPYTIVLADDHMLFRQGIKRIIEENHDIKVIGEAGDGLTLLKLLKTITPELVILDISMPLLRGLEAARELKRSYPKIKILLLTMHKKKDFLQQAIEAGADGFMLKEDADYGLIQAIQAIRRGEKYFSPLLVAKLAELAEKKTPPDPLTNRERQIVKLLAEGRTSQEIADLLFISVFTVRRHRDNIMRKLKLERLADLVRYAIDRELI
ncbi:MAG: response regulator transcription factor [Deltaproteobacteria bacterium]|nr:response regulator transcription factor [Deltaproteobacteria bacterium]